MVLSRRGEAVEHDLGRSVGDVVAVAVGNEQELGRAHQPDAAEAELDAREHLHVLGEDGAFVEPAVAVGVVEDQHAVAEPEVELRGQLGISEVLRDPQPPARIPGHGDGVLDIRLGREDPDVEPRRDAEAGRGLVGRQSPGRRGLGIGRAGDGHAGGMDQECCRGEGNQAEDYSMSHGVPGVGGGRNWRVTVDPA